MTIQRPLKFLLGVLLILVVLILSGCEESLPPVVFSTDVTAVTMTTASSGGSITSEGGSAVTARGVCWNTEGEPTTADSKTSDGEGGGAFESALTGLTAGTTYFLRAYATNSGGTSYGEQLTFTTVPIPDLPAVTFFGIAVPIGETTARVTGGLNSTGGGTTTAGVCWSTSPNPTTADAKQSNVYEGTALMDITMTGLTPSTTYYVRFFATNFSGTVYSEQKSFKTLGPIILQSSLTYNNNGYWVTIKGTVVDSGGGIVEPNTNLTGVVSGTAHNPVKGGPDTYNFGDTSNDPNIILINPNIVEIPRNENMFNVPIYFRPYTNNEVSTYYGPEVSTTIYKKFPSPGVTDIDGNSYTSLRTAYTEFTTTNLIVTKLNDGTVIPLVTDAAQWAALTTPAYTFYNNDASNNGTYGVLYNRYAVETGKLCPSGWHVPTFDEYSLMGYFSFCSYPVNCAAYRVGGDSGFEGRLGGRRNEDGSFSNMSTSGYWWASDPLSSGKGRMFYQDFPITTSSYFTLSDPKAGLSVRCVKN